MAIAQEQTATPATRIAPSRRRPELDALRGFFLVWMTLNHLPTRLSDYFNQPFGFVSSAEGFVFPLRSFACDALRPTCQRGSGRDARKRSGSARSVSTGITSSCCCSPLRSRPP